MRICDMSKKEMLKIIESIFLREDALTGFWLKEGDPSFSDFDSANEITEISKRYRIVWSNTEHTRPMEKKVRIWLYDVETYTTTLFVIPLSYNNVYETDSEWVSLENISFSNQQTFKEF